MAANEVDPGPAMRHVVDNVKRLRGELRLSQAQLSELLTEVGRPIRATGLHRLETGKRRVDADDLVALALAFGVSPITLLMPPVEGGEDEVALTETVSAEAQAVWNWLTARRPLNIPDDEDRSYAVAAFLRNSIPRAFRNATVRTVGEIQRDQEGGERGEHPEAG